MSSFDEDMREMRREAVAEIVFHINSSPELYNQFKNTDHKMLKALVYEVAHDNSGWFGTVYEPMLDGLISKDWKGIVEKL